MPEMMGFVLLLEKTAKTARRPHEFEELLHRNRLSTRISAAVKRLAQRWVG